MRSSNQKLAADERGLASIVVSIVIITVVSITVFGFAAIMRRESRQAIDQQLSSQAFYAAESALNQKAEEIRGNPNTPEVTACTPADAFQSNAEFARSTCVLVDNKPTSLEYDEVTTNNSLAVVLTPDAGQSIGQLNISWDIPSEGGSCSTASYNNFPRSLGPNDIGLLKLDITEVDTNNYSRGGLINETFSAVLYPVDGGTASASANSSQPLANTSSPIIFGRCVGGSSLQASASIAFPGAGTQPLLLRLRGIYKSSKVQITADNVSGGLVRFVGAQATIDSTARVGDVVRRLRAKVPLLTPSDLPDYAIRSTDGICKLISTSPATTSLGSCP